MNEVPALATAEPDTGMAARIAAFDWSTTPLGARAQWSPRFAALVDLMLATPQPTWIAWGPEHLCLYNDAHVDVLGSKHPAALGRPLLETWAEMADQIAPVMRATLAGESQFFAERPFPLAGRPGCPEGWFTYSHVPIRDEHGVVVGVYSAGVETTTRVLADRDRREAIRRAADAEAAVRVRSEFLANMSHEIRTPMSGVLGLAQLGQRESAHDPALRARFEQILECGKLLTTVINDVLDFSKIDAGKLDVEAVEFEPARVVAGTLQLFETAASRKGLALCADVGPDVPSSCVGDPTRVQQVLLNLVSNAVKFTSHGAVVLSARRVGAALEFAVVDTGCGIAPDARARIFEPFEQGDGTVTRRYGGTGLGLAISQRLAQLMDGSLSVESEAGVGSTFRFTMPLRANERPDDARDPPPAGAPRRLEGIRALAAEDDEFCALILRSVLETEGATVHVVGDGLQALGAIERAPSAFDVVLTDVQMPGIDGIELTRRLRAIAPALPVIGQTAHALRDEIQRCLAAGMCATVQKPYEFDAFVATVARHARRATADG